MAMTIAFIQQEIEKIKGVTVGPLKQVSIAISNYLPQIIGALVILAAGWLAAVILRKVTGKALRALGLDVVSERVGIMDILQRGGIIKRPSELLGWLIYWLILFSTLVATFNVLGLSMASVLLQAIVTYIPHLLIALLLLGLGFFASRRIDKMVTATAAAFNLPAPDAWGRAAQGLILFVTVVIAMGELNISTRIVNLSFLVLLAVAGIAAAIAFGLGTRRVVEQFTAGQSLCQWLHPGDVVQCHGHDGTIEMIGPTHVNIRTRQGIVALPNTVVLNTTIVKPMQEMLPPSAPKVPALKQKMLS